MADAKIKDGDFVVWTDRWTIDVQKAIKVTGLLVFYKSKYSDAHRRVRIADVVFSGDEKTARRLAEQLRSSMTLMHDDETKARHRRDELARYGLSECLLSPEPKT